MLVSVELMATAESKVSVIAFIFRQHGVEGRRQFTADGVVESGNEKIEYGCGLGRISRCSDGKAAG